MQKHTYRTIVIWAVIVIGLINIYPTLGWMCLSDKAKEIRLDRWEREDAEYRKPNYWRDSWKGLKRWAEFDRDKVVNLGLDLQGGIHMVLGLDTDALTPDQKQAYEDAGWSEREIKKDLQRSALQRIRRRINEFEAKEPIIQTLGDDKIQIQLPGEKRIERAKELIMKNAFLTFHMVAGRDETIQVIRAVDKHFNNNFVPLLRKPANLGGSYEIPVEYFDRVRAVVEKAHQAPGLMPEDKIFGFSEKPDPWDQRQAYQIYVMNEEPEMSGEGLTGAMARQDPNRPPNWMILFRWKGEAAKRFAEVTENNIHRSMAIVVDGVVVSAPTIESRIFGSGQITGAFDQEEAGDLAIALNSGAMPVPIIPEYTSVVGASLGADSVRKGVISSIVGISIVMLFMVAYYRIGGLIANVALALNAVFVLAALSYFNGTLTLPGIAGLILTVGMAVDANVLSFERIREELRNGKSLLASIESGYSRATVTILDANVTTLIAAVVLMQFGTGPIQGFAVTLSIGVCASVFTALIVTRAIFDFLTTRKLLTKLTMASFVKPDTKFQFLGRRNMAFTASAIVIAAGLVVFGARGWDNFGVDFTNGTNMEVRLAAWQPVEIGAVRTELTKAGFENAIVQRISEDEEKDVNRFLIRIGERDTEKAIALAAPPAGADPADDTDAPDVTVSAIVQRTLARLCDNPDEATGPVELLRVETIGPAVGAQLRKDAQGAILYALLFIIAYLWFRFEFKFALGAVAALVHDVLITVGLFAVTGRQISMPVIAALLTIIGYSLNDTIVVFDRIREDLRLYRGRGLSYPEVMDLSINQTLSRTLLTSLTTLFVVVVLFIFGGKMINDFAFALIVGVLVGTYSSIFVASPLVYLLQTMQRKQILPTGGRKDEGSSRKRGRGGKGKKKEATA